MSDESDGFRIVAPYWFDTDAYTDRDRLMFVCGAEFEMVMDYLRSDDNGPMGRTIHKENESRIRLLCGRFGRGCTITPVEHEHDPLGTWSYLVIEERQP